MTLLYEGFSFFSSPPILCAGKWVFRLLRAGFFFCAGTFLDGKIQCLSPSLHQRREPAGEKGDSKVVPSDEGDEAGALPLP